MPDKDRDNKNAELLKLLQERLPEPTGLEYQIPNRHIPFRDLPLPTSLTLDFADGPRTLPDWVVVSLGEEQLKDKTFLLAIKKVKYATFMQKFQFELERSWLRQTQKDFVAAHMTELQRREEFQRWLNGLGKV
jgi:hypothetical protein